MTTRSICFEHKKLYSMKGEVPEKEYLLPFGKADIKREGKDVTVVAYSFALQQVMKVAAKLAEKVSVEIVDPRSLNPLDIDTILTSVKKTRHALIVHEAWKTGGFGAEIAARIADEGFHFLDAPVKRLGAKDFPIPFARGLENFILPQETDIENAIIEAAG